MPHAGPATVAVLRRGDVVSPNLWSKEYPVTHIERYMEGAPASKPVDMVFTATVAGGATIRMGDDLRQFVVRKLVEPGTCRCCQQTFEPQAEAGLRTVVCAECFPNLSRVVQATMRRDYRTWVSQTEIDKE